MMHFGKLHYRFLQIFTVPASHLQDSITSSVGRMEHLYEFDESKVDALRKAKAWMLDPKYFKRVKISPSATIKMMTHGQSGVEKGTKQSGKPIEVMGLLLGRPDTEDPNCLIISDAQALPIEGFETRVVADDENVINYMIELGESFELSRKERFCGWYHTHPFDLDVFSNCFLSNTDLSTQLQWQRAEDPHGNPWLAIVIDPLYSLAKGRPEMMAFRVYPPEYSPPSNETPDGTIVADDRLRVQRWGSCWNRYYKLELSYYMSHLAQSTLNILKDKLLWHLPLCTTAALDADNSAALIESINAVADRVNQGRHSGGGAGGGDVSGDGSSSSYPSPDGRGDKSERMNMMAKELGCTSCCSLSSQMSKLVLFAESVRARQESQKMEL